MQGFDLSTVSGIYMGADSIYGLYIGSTLIWPTNYEHEYFTITSMVDLEPGYTNTIKFHATSSNIKQIDVSYDKETWTTYSSSIGGTVIAQLRKGQKIYIRGNNSCYANNGSRNTYFSSLKVNLSGNIMSLIDSHHFDDPVHYQLPTTLTEPYAFAYMFQEMQIEDASNLVLSATTLSAYCYRSLFSRSTVVHPPRILPATTLTEGCYYNMFASTDIDKAPIMPATTLAPYCYAFMFNSCNFTIAPILPVTTLAEGCYYGMFQSCYKIVVPPALPATTLAPSCYRQMFSGCRLLKSAPELPATTMADNCYDNMFSVCTMLSTPPALPATTLAPYCYYEMFRDCMFLSAGPVLPATTLATRCYAGMFADCSQLSSITILTTDAQLYDKNALSNWVSNVAPRGSFTKISYELIIEGSDSGIPDGWTIYYADSNVYSVSIGTVTNGTVTSDKQTASYTETVTLTVTPNTGYELEILKVIDGNGNRITVTNNQFEMPDSNVTITASFAYYEDMYFTIESEVDNNVIVWKNDSNSYKQRMYFSTDLVNWNSWESTETGIILTYLNAGDRLYLKANLSYSTSFHSYFVSGGNFKVYGNSMSLIYGDNFANQTSVSSYALQYLFENCTYLTDASNLILPATTLASYCYQCMFNGCTSLTTAPALNATTLADYCYYMMFEGCTALITAPELPATTLEYSCYNRMFMGCTSLNSITMLATDVSAFNCLGLWVYGVAATGTFHRNASMTTLIRGNSGIPKGWVIDPPIYQKEYLTIESLENNNAIGWKSNDSTTKTIQWSTDKTTWTSATSSTSGTLLTTLNAGGKLYIKGTNNTYGATWNTWSTFTSTKTFNLYGNIMSMIYGDNFENTDAPSYDCIFWRMFQQSRVVDASNLILPATVRSYMYVCTFLECASLTAAPVIPNGAAYMSFNSMFARCTSLVTAPVIRANPGTYSYREIFDGCTSVNSVTVYATSLGSGGFDNWVRNVAATGTFTKLSTMTSFPSGNSGIPSGWTVVNV